MEFVTNDKTYTDYTVGGVSCTTLNPEQKKLITGDIIDEVGNIIRPSEKRSRLLQGILVASGSTFGRANRNKLYYRCVPDDKTLPIYLVAYEDKTTGFEKRKVDRLITFKMIEWKEKHPIGQIVETIGNVDDMEAFAEYQLRCRNVSTAIQKFNKDVFKKVTSISN